MLQLLVSSFLSFMSLSAAELGKVVYNPFLIATAPKQEEMQLKETDVLNPAWPISAASNGEVRALTTMVRAERPLLSNSFVNQIIKIAIQYNNPRTARALLRFLEKEERDSASKPLVHYIAEELEKPENTENEKAFILLANKCIKKDTTAESKPYARALFEWLGYEVSSKGFIRRAAEWGNGPF